MVAKLDVGRSQGILIGHHDWETKLEKPEVLYTLSDQNSSIIDVLLLDQISLHLLISDEDLTEKSQVENILIYNCKYKISSDILYCILDIWVIIRETILIRYDSPDQP